MRRLFLYLGQTLEDVNGDKYRMAGVLPGEGFKVGHLVRFGYATLTAKENSMLLKKTSCFLCTNFTTGIPPKTA